MLKRNIDGYSAQSQGMIQINFACHSKVSGSSQNYTIHVNDFSEVLVVLKQVLSMQIFIIVLKFLTPWLSSTLLKTKIASINILPPKKAQNTLFQGNFRKSYTIVTMLPLGKECTGPFGCCNKVKIKKIQTVFRHTPSS